MDPAGLVHAPAAAAHKEEVWGWWEAQSLRRIPGEIWELAPSSRWPQHRTRPRTPNLLRQPGRTRNSAGSARVFLLRQENAQEKAFSQRPKIFWQIFGSILTLACEGRWRGEAAASGSVPGETFGGRSRVWWWGPAHPPAFINPCFSWCFNFGMGLGAGRSGVGE